MRALSCNVKGPEVQKLVHQFSTQDCYEIDLEQSTEIMLRKYKERSREVNIGKLSAVDDEERQGKRSGVSWEKVDLKPDGQVREVQAGIFHNFLESRVSNSQNGDIGDAQVSLSLQLAAADGAVSELMKANIERNILASCPVPEAVDAQEGLERYQHEFRKRQPSVVLDLFKDGPALGLCSFATAPSAPASKGDEDVGARKTAASFLGVPPPSELGADGCGGQGAGPSFLTAPSTITSKDDEDGAAAKTAASFSGVPPPSELGAERSGGQGAGLSFLTAPSTTTAKDDEDGAAAKAAASFSGVPPPRELGAERSGGQFAGLSFLTAPSALTAKADEDVGARKTAASFSGVPPPSELGAERSGGQGAGPSLIHAVLSNVSTEDGSSPMSWPEAPQGRGKAVVRRGRARPGSAENREAAHKRSKINGLYSDAPPSIELTVNYTLPPPKEPFSLDGSQKFASFDEAHNISATVPEKEPGDQIVEEAAPTRCSGITLVGNQCTHNVKHGSKFCVKHTPKLEVDHSSTPSNHGIPFTAYKQTDIVIFRCRGITLRGLHCTHNVKDGGAYCLKHEDQAWGPPPRCIEGGMSSQTYPPAYEYETPHQIPVQIQETPVREPIHVIAPPSPQEKDDGVGGARCIGRTRRNDEQCSFRAKPGSLYCERHSRQFQEKRKLEYDPTCEAPSSSSPSAGLTLRKGWSQEVKNLPNMSSTEEQRSLFKAKDLFTEVLNAGIWRGQVVTQNGKDVLGWVLEEAIKDLSSGISSGEKLLGLLAEEKEKVSKIIIKDSEKFEKVKSPHFWKTKYTPNLARTYSDRTGGEKNDVLQRNGANSSATCGTSESRPPFAENTKQGSESDRDVLTCALCSTKFVEMRHLAKHWKENHKKEALLFQRGMACSACGQEYTNKGGLQRHWRSTHPRLPIENFSLHVCVCCDAKFKDFKMLWMHVEDKHFLEFSSTAFAERHIKVDDGGPKFRCKSCFKRFFLLPDLGRHHQAVHKDKDTARNPLDEEDVEFELPPSVKRTPLPNPETADSPPGKMLPLSEIGGGIAEQGEHQGSVEMPHLMLGSAAQPPAFNFRHLKTIAREKRKTEEKVMDVPHVPPHIPQPAPAPAAEPAPAPAAQLAPAPAPQPAAATAPQLAASVVASKKGGKKKLGRPAKKIVEHMKTVEHNPVQQKTEPQPQRPESGELLDAAKIACCKESWYRELAKKYTYLDPHLHRQARAMFAVMRPDIQWISVDEYSCPNQCSPFHVTGAAVTALEVDMAGFSGTPFKAQADHVNDIGPASMETVNIKDVIKGKRLVINEDFSNGQEPVPIPCVIDEEVFLRPCSCTSCQDTPSNPSLDIAEPWKCFTYTNKRLLDPSLGLDTESSKLGCGCGGDTCDPSHCDHVTMFASDNDDACDKSGVAMGQRFAYDEHGRIILEEGFMVYECNSSCSCGKDCHNRVLQKGVRVKLEVFKSRHKGWGVRSAEPILAGTFVCEYTGEVLDDRVANQRGVRYDLEGCSYLYNIDHHLVTNQHLPGVPRAKPFVIDATKHGNVARFINHSCDPNLKVYSVLVDSVDCRMAHIGLFACRDIGAGEELAYDYKYKILPGKGQLCHCGALKCRKRLY